MIKYFKELLATLKGIHYEQQITNENLKRISSCVVRSSRTHGDSHSLSTKHWND